MKIKVKKGEWLILYFDDHVEDGGRPMSCIVVGRVQKKGHKYITLASWYVLASKEIQKINNKEFTILTCAVKGYSTLYPDWVGRRPHGM